MRNKFILIALVLTIGNAQAADHDPKVIFPLLKDAKMTLLQGIEYAEKTSGVATSAKFEVDNGQLILSIYTVPEGLGVEPEKANLSEFAGLATDELSKFKAEVFADKAHIARSSVHMTLFQMSKMTLREVIQKALAKQPGIAIDVRNPIVRKLRPVADVIIVAKDEDGDENYVHTISVDLLSGSVKNR